MNDPDDLSSLHSPIDDPFLEDEEPTFDTSHLWVISYSDFMTILMIFFLMLFAHRLWAKKVSWEACRVEQLHAARENQQGMVERLSKLADVDVKTQRIDIHLPDALLFDAGHADLRPSAEALITQLTPDLKKFTGDVVVEGHTDDLPLGPNARFHSNWELSVARAFSVIRCLTDNGMDPTHLSARGYGPYRPRVLNDSPEHRAENRRIEIVLLNPKKNAP